MANGGSVRCYVKGRVAGLGVLGDLEPLRLPIR